MATAKLAHFSPARTILASIFIMISIGTLLLALPMARTEEISLIDLFFTATSATCVTGLFTIKLASFTTFGKLVLLGLIQIGGLGMITLTLFFLSLFMEMGLATQLMGGQLLEIETWKDLKKILFFICLFTIYAELLGAFCYFSVLHTSHPIADAWLLSVFQAVSSFCNAGISLIHDQSDLISLDYTTLLTTTALMILGGLGFITWHELIRRFRTFFDKKRYRISLNSKIVIFYYFAMIGIVGLLFWMIERDTTLSSMNPLQQFVISMFHAVSFKSCGFATTLIQNFQLATLLLMMVTAFIGCAPGSTGSGIKITTFAIFLSTIKAALLGKAHVHIRGREIPLEQVYKTVAIIGLAIGWIIISTFCLLITEQGFSFLDILFENVCAFTTLGFSTGISPELSQIGKIFIMLSMLMGRIGSLTLVLAIRTLKKSDTVEFAYPEERVMLG